MCKTSSSTERSQVVKIARCRPPPNNCILSSYATPFRQQAALCWTLSHHSLIIALVIFGVLPDLTGVASISPATQSRVSNKLNNNLNIETSGRVAAESKHQKTPGHRKTPIINTYNYSLALLPSEWSARKGTSRDVISSRRSSIDLNLFVDSLDSKSEFRLSPNEKTSEAKSTHPEITNNLRKQSKWLHSEISDTAISKNGNDKIQLGASTQERDSKQLLSTSNNRVNIGLTSSCPNCKGSNRLSFPYPLYPSSLIWSKLKLSNFSTPNRSRRRILSVKHQLSGYNRRGGLDKGRQQSLNATQVSLQTRRSRLPSPILRHHGAKSAWWWNLMSQNRPRSTYSSPDTLSLERESRSTHDGHSYPYSSDDIFLPYSWQDVSTRGERSIKHGGLPKIDLYTDQHRNMCLHYHDMYDAKGNTNFDLKWERDSVVADYKLISAEQWEKEICKKSDKSLEYRVKKILDGGLKGICDEHYVCEIFSPEDLQKIGSNDLRQCSSVVNKWWRKFHRLYISIRHFEQIYQPKFDAIQLEISPNDTTTDGDDAGYNITMCKEAYVYWACSTELPLYLHRQNGNLGNVEVCKDTCRDVEKSCPFHVRESELDTASGNSAFMCQDEEIDLGLVDSSHCCYSRMNWNGGNHVNNYIENKQFCYEPDLSSGAMQHDILGSSEASQTSDGGIHQLGWNSSPSSSSSKNTSKHNLSIWNSSFDHLTLPKPFTKATPQNTQFHTLPAKGHDVRMNLLSSSSADSMSDTEVVEKNSETFSQKYAVKIYQNTNKDNAHANHKHNDMLLNDDLMEQENTCDFILPQREKHRLRDSKDLFPFEVRWRKSHEKDHGNPTSANPSPSTDLSLPPMDNEENDAPPEVRYVRSLFSDFQEFVEHIGRTPEELQDDLKMASSGASASPIQPIVVRQNHILSSSLWPIVEELKSDSWYTTFLKTQGLSKTMIPSKSNIEKHEERERKHSRHHFHPYIKSISLAVLVLFSFWWWYISIWHCGLFVGNVACISNSHHRVTNHGLGQKHKLKMCATSECVIITKTNVTNPSSTRGVNVIENMYQPSETWTHLNER